MLVKLRLEDGSDDAKLVLQLQAHYGSKSVSKVALRAVKEHLGLLQKVDLLTRQVCYEYEERKKTDKKIFAIADALQSVSKHHSVEFDNSEDQQPIFI